MAQIIHGLYFNFEVSRSKLQRGHQEHFAPSLAVGDEVGSRLFCHYDPHQADQLTPHNVFVNTKPTGPEPDQPQTTK